LNNKPRTPQFSYARLEPIKTYSRLSCPPPPEQAAATAATRPAAAACTSPPSSTGAPLQHLGLKGEGLGFRV